MGTTAAVRSALLDLDHAYDAAQAMARARSAADLAGEHHPEALRSTHQWVYAEHPTLAEAIREAIEAAEQRGWSR